MASDVVIMAFKAPIQKTARGQMGSLRPGAEVYWILVAGIVPTTRRQQRQRATGSYVRIIFVRSPAQCTSAEPASVGRSPTR